MLNYIIYQIKCLDTKQVYIGSTRNTLKERMKGHKKPSNKCRSKIIIDRGNYEEEVLLYCSCKDRKELCKIEGNFIISEPNCINKSIAGRSPTEYRVDNAELLKKKAKLWFDNNKDKVSKYNEETKEKRKKWNKNSGKKKEWYILHKKELSIKNKEKYKWISSWGGATRTSNNLLQIKI